MGSLSPTSSPSAKREIHLATSPPLKPRVNSPCESPDTLFPNEANNINNDGNGVAPTADFVLSELIRQIPSLTGKEALPLSQMITGQLRRWNRSRPQLSFRRTQIIEQTSRASVTIIDFECYAMLNPNSSDTSHKTVQQHHYASTLVMSDISDSDNPDLQLGCLWAPAYDGREGATFTKEADHIISVFRQCIRENNDYRDRYVNAVAVMAVKPLFEKNFANWDTKFTSTEAAIQRACAWGIVAAKSREIEYRLFAASLSCFLNFELQKVFALEETKFDISVQYNQNDLCFTLIPVMKMSDVEVGKGLSVRL